MGYETLWNRADAFLQYLANMYTIGHWQHWTMICKNKGHSREGVKHWPSNQRFRITI